MRYAVQPVVRLACLQFIFCGLACRESWGQSFLEKLEAAVKQRLNESGSEQLPAPAGNGNTESERNGTSDSPSSPPMSRPPTGSEAVPPPTPAPPNPAAPSPGRIYLGLEAEELVGGGIGVRVAEITQQSPAWKAGFEVGDRIMAVNGYAIAKLTDMQTQLGKTAPGEAVEFLVSRSGRNLELTAVLMAADLARQLPSSRVANPDENAPAWLGVKVNDLTSSFRQQFGINVFRGAAVTQVTDGSPARKAGIRAGDAIIEADGNPIENAANLINWMSTVRPGQEIELLVYRGPRPRTVQVVLEIHPDARERRPSVPRGRSAQPASPPQDAVPAPVIPAPMPTPETGPSTELTAEIRRLKAENQRLQTELTSALRRLSDAQQQLEQVVDAIKRNAND